MALKAEGTKAGESNENGRGPTRSGLKEVPPFFGP